MVADKQDFTEKNLPINRGEEIKGLLKYRKKTLFSLGLLIIPFELPLLFWIIFSRYYLYSIVPTSEQAFMFTVTRDYPLIIFAFLFGFGLAGFFYCIRRLLFGETVKISFHFFKGLKESGFEFALFLSLSTILFMIFDILYVYQKACYSEGTLPFVGSILVVVLLVISSFIIVFAIPYILSSASLYVVSFNRAIKDGFKAAFKNLENNFLMTLFAILPWLLLIFEERMISMIINLIAISLILIFNVIITLILSSKAYDSYDQAVNKVNYPKYYRLGLRKEENNEVRTK